VSDERRRGLIEHPVTQMAIARTKQFLREPEAIFWVFVFPIVFSLALALAFRSEPPEPIRVGVLVGQPPAASDALAADLVERRLAAGGELETERVDERSASDALRSGKLPLVVVRLEPLELWLDPSRAEAREARLAVELAVAGGERARPAIRESKEKGARYVDFFVPGLLGMNLMGTGMWAIGFALVQQRQGGLLKRFIASPMKRWQFLVAQILARLTFLALEASVLLAFAHFLLDVPIRGALPLVALVAIVGAMTFVGLGLLTAARPRTIEGVSGVMNLVMVPMWVGSGIFFSTERFPDAMQPFVQALPLTALNDALRAVMLDGAGFAALAPELGLLALWGTVAFAAALKLFRWQ
jgi:ABC transporter DrrB family efflux protein